MHTLENYLVLRVLGSKNKMKSMRIYTAKKLMAVAKTLIFIKETANTLSTMYLSLLQLSTWLL